jgi:cell division protease FtsH
MSNEQQSGDTSNKTDKKKAPKRPLKPEEDGFKFNFFWIYAIVIAVLIMGFLSNFSDVTKPISGAEFKEMLSQRDVMAVKVVGHKNAMVYLNDSALLKPKYSEVTKSRFGSVNHGPHFSFTVASNDAFDKMMTDYNKEHQDQKEV